MAHEYELTLTAKDIGDTVAISGTFENEDWERLQEFGQYVDELLKTKLVQDGVPASLRMHWNHQLGMTILTELPPWDDVTVFLHKFRPIGLKSESTYFYKICNILGKELQHPYIRGMLEKQREIYNGKRMHAKFQLRSNDVVLNSEKVLDDWLNSYEYHRNKEKRKFIDDLHAMFPLDASKVLFLILLTEKTIAVSGIAALNRVVLGKQQYLESDAKRL